jgi:type IV pilus assembly protein PilC
MDAAGRKKSGYVEAADQQAAIAKLAQEGRYVTEITIQSGSAPKAATTTASNALIKEKKKQGRASRSDLALFTRRMADLAAAGLPLDRVLQVVAEQSESAQLTEVAEKTLEEVRGGMPVSQALSQHPRLFPPVYTETLRAGEASGQFAEVAARLADFQENEVTRRSQIVSALVYPAVLTIVAILVVIFMLTFVVPRLSDVFEGLGSDLPASTVLLLAMTSFITNNWLLIIGGLVAAVFLYRGWIATETGSFTRDSMLLKIPAVGPVMLKATISRYARVLGTLVFGGVPILEGLRLAGLASGNKVFQSKSTLVEEEVREGRAIADAMRDAGAFPPVLIHMVAIGEETGDLPKMLGRVSDSLDFEVDNGMRRLTAMVEPIIVLSMGLFVGFVVLSVLLPIFQAQDLVR